jgi:hypothetical protein
MNLDEAVKIAIQNGWTTFKGHKINSVRFIYSGDKRLAEVIEEDEGHSSSSTTFSYDEFFLDPLFWQSLGKGLRWEDELCSQCGKSPEKHIPRSRACPGADTIPDWLSRWHSFIDYVAKGKTVDDFFRELS